MPSQTNFTPCQADSRETNASHGDNRPVLAMAVVECVSHPMDSFQSQAAIFGPDFGGPGEVDAREEPSNFAASRMAPLQYSPARAPRQRILLRRARCRALTADPNGVAEGGRDPAGELALDVCPCENRAVAPWRCYRREASGRTWRCPTCALYRTTAV